MNCTTEKFRTKDVSSYKDHNESEYNCRRAITTRSQKQTSQIMGTTCITLRIRNTQNKIQHTETTNTNINSCPRKEKCLHYDKELWNNNNSLQGHHWNTQNADDKIIKMQEQKEALQKQKTVIHLGKIT